MGFWQQQPPMFATDPYAVSASRVVVFRYTVVVWLWPKNTGSSTKLLHSMFHWHITCLQCHGKELLTHLCRHYGNLPHDFSIKPISVSSLSRNPWLASRLITLNWNNFQNTLELARSYQALSQPKPRISFMIASPIRLTHTVLDCINKVVTVANSTHGLELSFVINCKCPVTRIGACHCLIGSFLWSKIWKSVNLGGKDCQLPRLHHCCRTWQPLATLSLHDSLISMFLGVPDYDDPQWECLCKYPPLYSGWSHPEECGGPKILFKPLNM